MNVHVYVCLCVYLCMCVFVHMCTVPLCIYDEDNRIAFYQPVVYHFMMQIFQLMDRDIL